MVLVIKFGLGSFDDNLEWATRPLSRVRGEIVVLLRRYLCPPHKLYNVGRWEYCVRQFTLPKQHCNSGLLFLQYSLLVSSASRSNGSITLRLPYIHLHPTCSYDFAWEADSVQVCQSRPFGWWTQSSIIHGKATIRTGPLHREWSHHPFPYTSWTE